MSRVPLLEPVVLITSVPPGSPGRKKRHKEYASESTLIGSSRKKMCLGSSSESSIPSAHIEILLPPLGSWKDRLFGGSDRVRICNASLWFLTDASKKHSELYGCHAQQTVVTPKVYDLSVTMFQQEFRVVTPLKQEALKSYSHPLNFTEVHGASLTMKWVGLPSVYSAIRIGQSVYKVFIMFFSQDLC